MAATPTTKPKTNWLSVAAFVSLAALLVVSALGLLGIAALGTGWGIFTIAIGFNGVICAILSFHLR